MRRNHYALRWNAAALAFGLAGLFSVGCYNPDLTSGRFACTDSTQCPNGQLCVNGRCASDAPQPDGATPPPEVDGSSPPVRDMATPPPADMATPPPADMTSGLPMVDGCARGGYKVTNDVFACPGAIAAGKAGDLCTGNGFHLCGERPITDGGRLSGVQGCPTGFYAIAGGAWFGRNNNKNDLNCRQQNGYKAALVGCGTEAKATTKVADTTDCFGTAYPTNVRTALVCQDQAADSPWKCNDSLSNATHTPADPAQGGVLCCRD